MLARCLNHSYSDLEIVSISQARLKASVMNLILTKIRESYLDKISLFKKSQFAISKSMENNFAHVGDTKVASPIRFKQPII